MLIPNFFKKDDETNTKKGTIEPHQLSALISRLAPKQTGILNIFENPCGVDNLSIQGVGGVATITLRKGYILICGRLISITDNTTLQLTLPASGTINGAFGIRVDLANSGNSEVDFFISNDTLQQDDLNTNIANGVYEFRLYNAVITPTEITLSNKTTEVIEDMQTFFNGANFTTQALTDNSNKIATTKFVQDLLAQVIGYSNYTSAKVFTDNRSTTHNNRYYVFDFLGKRFVYGNINVNTRLDTGVYSVGFNENVFNNTSARYLIGFTGLAGAMVEASANNSFNLVVTNSVTSSASFGYLFIESRSDE